MTVPDLLLAFMAAAIALAGFAGIVAVIDRGAAGVSADVASFRIRYLAYIVATVVILSILPLLAVLLGGGSAVWRIGCGIEAAVALIYMVQLVRIRRRYNTENARGMNLSAYRLVMTLGLPVVGLLVAGAAGFVPASAGYAAGVFWFFLGILGTFVRLVLMLDDAMRNTRGAGE